MGRSRKCSPPQSPFFSGTVTESSSLRGYRAPAHGLRMTQSPQATRENSDKSKFLKIKFFCIAKPAMSKDKTKMPNKGKLSATCITDRELISLIYKEVLSINKKKANNQ